MEMINGDHVCHGTLHTSKWPTDNCTHVHNSETKTIKMNDFSENFHEFAVEWMEGYMAFYVDG